MCYNSIRKSEQVFALNGKKERKKMKYIETTIAKNEKVNEHGVTIINEVIKIETSCTKEFVWYRVVGGHRCIVCSFKTEKRMREAMVKIGF